MNLDWPRTTGSKRPAADFTVDSSDSAMSDSPCRAGGPVAALTFHLWRLFQSIPFPSDWSEMPRGPAAPWPKAWAGGRVRWKRDRWVGRTCPKTCDGRLIQFFKWDVSKLKYINANDFCKTQRSRQWGCCWAIKPSTGPSIGRDLLPWFPSSLFWNTRYLFFGRTVRPSGSSSPHRRTFYVASTGRCLIEIYFYVYTCNIRSHSICYMSGPILSTLQISPSLPPITAPWGAPVINSVIYKKKKKNKTLSYGEEIHTRDQASVGTGIWILAPDCPWPLDPLHNFEYKQ